MIPRYIDWIWHVRGSLALAPGQSRDEAFDRLDPLFHQPGTSHERMGDTLVFTKKDQAAQDKMSVFDNGVLEIANSDAGPVLRYDLMSRTLLFCFLAPLLFLAIAQGTVALGKLEKKPTAAELARKKADAQKPVPKLNPIDKALGAPEPEKKKKKDDAEKKGKKRSPTPAYVFAGIFAALFVGGRILEDWLIKRLFRKRLDGDESGAAEAAASAG